MAYATQTHTQIYICILYYNGVFFRLPYLHTYVLLTYCWHCCWPQPATTVTTIQSEHQSRLSPLEFTRLSTKSLSLCAAMPCRWHCVGMALGIGRWALGAVRYCDNSCRITSWLLVSTFYHTLSLYHFTFELLCTHCAVYVMRFVGVIFSRHSVFYSLLSCCAVDRSPLILPTV